MPYKVDFTALLSVKQAAERLSDRPWIGAVHLACQKRALAAVEVQLRAILHGLSHALRRRLRLRKGGTAGLRNAAFLMRALS